MTAAIGLFRNVGLDITDDLDKLEVGKLTDATKKQSVLVYGASSTVGVFVTQLAKKLGLFVVGVAGGSIDAAKSYGADIVLDYRSSSFESDLNATVKAHDIHAAFDTVSEKHTYTHIIGALTENAGGDLTTFVPLDKDTLLPAGVKHHLTYVGQAHSDDKLKPFARKNFTLAEKWLESGELRGQRVTIVPGGLAGVEEGLDWMQEGKVSGEKLVYRIAETPGLA